MSVKIFFVVAALILFIAWPASSQMTTGQDIDQNASNVFQGRANNSSVSQSSMQTASQEGSVTSGFSFADNASPGSEAGSISPVTTPQAGPSAPGMAGTTGAASNLSATQNVSIQSYVSGQPPAQLTSEQRSVITTTTEQFLTSYPVSDMFIMPVSDLEVLVPQNRASFFILDVSRQTSWSSQVPALDVVRIPLPSLVSRLNEIPVDRAIVVVSDNQIDSAVGMTILRMYGYNAWLAQTGSCLPAGAISGTAIPGAVTGFAGTVQSESTTFTS